VANPLKSLAKKQEALQPISAFNVLNTEAANERSTTRSLTPSSLQFQRKQQPMEKKQRLLLRQNSAPVADHQFPRPKLGFATFAAQA
jgi:hypothetical protein